MKIRKTALLLVLVGGLLGVAPAIADSAGEFGYVQVSEDVVRSRPIAYSSEVARVHYKQKVKILGTEGGFYKISIGGRVGYLHRTAILGQSGGTPSARNVLDLNPEASDIALAGKGFEAAAEGEYIKSNPALSRQFHLLEEAGRMHVSDSEIVAFIKEGGL